MKKGYEQIWQIVMNWDVFIVHDFRVMILRYERKSRGNIDNSEQCRRFWGVF